MTKITSGHKWDKLSSKQRQIILQWLPVKQEVHAAAHKMTYRVINGGIPEEISNTEAHKWQISQNKGQIEVGNQTSLVGQN